MLNKLIPIYNGSVAIRTIFKSSPEFNYDKNNISLVMLKNAHIVIYPINKQGELNLVCIVRQKLSNSIDLNTLVKNEILSQNKNLENLFKNKLEYWPIYITKKPSKSNIESSHRVAEALLAVAESYRQGRAWIQLPVANRDLYVFHV